MRIQNILKQMNQLQINDLKLIVEGHTFTGGTIYDNLMFRVSTFDVFKANSIDEFIALWSYYTNSYAFTFSQMYKAINTAYNPLENYNRTESGKEITKNTVTGSTSVTTEIDNISPSTTISYATTEDSNNFNETDKQVTTGKTTTTTSPSDDYMSQSETSFDGRTTSGNIGVTTTQQMATAEIDLRTQNLFLNTVIDIFVGEFCI